MSKPKLGQTKYFHPQKNELMWNNIYANAQLEDAFSLTINNLTPLNIK